MYTCECADGRTITGLSRWDLAELKKMSPLEPVSYTHLTLPTKA